MMRLPKKQNVWITPRETGEKVLEDTYGQFYFQFIHNQKDPYAVDTSGEKKLLALSTPLNNT